jgi:long-chain fatty acid transport protein
MLKPVESISIGASYRSKIDVSYDGESTFTSRPTGNAALDAIVAASLPTGNPPVHTEINFPSSIMLGVGIQLPAQFLLSLEADWTEWSRFQSLAITFPTLVGRDIFRPTLWEDRWAYRAGLEKCFGPWAIRVGYYYDNTPQPDFDVSPILPDNDRNVYTGGFGYNTERWGFDVAAVYIAFKDRTVIPPTPQTDNYFGTYSEKALVLTAGIRLAL